MLCCQLVISSSFYAMLNPYTMHSADSNLRTLHRSQSILLNLNICFRRHFGRSKVKLRGWANSSGHAIQAMRPISHASPGCWPQSVQRKRKAKARISDLPGAGETCLRMPNRLQSKRFPTEKYSCYVPVMTDAFVPRLPFSPRRCGGSVAPCFSYGAGCTQILIQCQLPEFSAIFGKGCLDWKYLLFARNPSDDPLSPRRCGGLVMPFFT
jgi:hypothetical protein